MSFDSLGLSENILRSLEELSYGQATPIQAKAIPIVLSGKDVLAAAQTGSGKTATFVLPILQRLSDADLSENFDPLALVLVPTRELAAQVGASVERYGQYLKNKPRTVEVFGGVAIPPQVESASKGVDIVVATPGRLIDLIEREAISLSNIKTLVLDEADRLLALGFEEEINKILKLLPAERQNALFSATFPKKVMELADALLVEPEKIELEAEVVPVDRIAQRAIAVDRDSRTALLKHLLEKEKWDRVLVFVASKRRAHNVAVKLSKSGIQATELHGDLSQEKRSKALERFKANKVRVLMATDVAARGIDIAQLPSVVNYDLPRSTTDYAHRIGRTGRAGESGVAVSFITSEDEEHFKLIEKRNKVTVARELIEGFEPAPIEQSDKPVSKLPVKGKRPSKKDKLRAAKAAKEKALGFQEKMRPKKKESEPASLPVEEPTIAPEKVEERNDVSETDSPPSPWANALKKVKED
ncbi:DEAD/DEAH box helicase [Puniceicoccaceae bacterium K14]|nr:DEAD/DEAH box helicase [Puniceicoccaceae bacterium K14]